MKKKIVFIILLLSYIGIIITVFYTKIVKTVVDIPAVKVTTYAKSYIAMETNTHRVLSASNEKARMLPASITKILTCITCIENYNLNDIIVVSDLVNQCEGSSIYLKVGDVITVKDLLYGLMLCSGNDAATVLAYHLSGNVSDFIYLMNRTAKKIGMNDSTFENPSGLDTTTKNYTTAYDMALLMSYAMNNTVFREITSTKNYVANLLDNKKMYFSNKHRLIKGDVAIGGKTGYTKLAGRTLVSVFEKDDMEIVIVTLGCGNDWEFHQNLAKECFNTYHNKQIISKFELYFKMKKNKNYFVKKADLLVPIAYCEKIDYRVINNNDNLVIQYLKQEEVICEKVLNKRS